jgi:hypothetical protein
VRQILEKSWEQNIDVYNPFIDFQATYDTVWRVQIWSEMHKLGFPKKLVKMCIILNNEILYMLRLKLVNIYRLNLKLT